MKSQGKYSTKTNKELSIKAHEIKNLLAGISGAITVLFEDISPDDPNKEIINEVISRTERLDKAIKELINYVRSIKVNKDA